MENVFFGLAIAAFVIAGISLIACIVIFFKSDVPNAIRFLQHKPLKNAKGGKSAARKQASKQIRKKESADKARTSAKMASGPVVEHKKRVGSTSAGLAADERALGISTPAEEGAHAKPAPVADDRATGNNNTTAKIGAQVAAGNDRATGRLAQESTPLGADDTPTDVITAGKHAAGHQAVEESELPTGLLELEESEQPTGLLDLEDSEQPTGLLDIEDSERPTGLLEEEDSERPTGLLEEEESERPTGLLETEESERPTGLLETEPSERPTDVLPSQEKITAEIPVEELPAATAAETSGDDFITHVDVAQQDEEGFCFIVKQNEVVVHTQEKIA